MAQSTGFVVAAGVLVIAEDIVTDKWNTGVEIRRAVATVIAAYVSAGLDKLIPGFGTGASVVLLVGVVLSSGVRVLNGLQGGQAGVNTASGSVSHAGEIAKAK